MTIIYKYTQSYNYESFPSAILVQLKFKLSLLLCISSCESWGWL